MKLPIIGISPGNSYFKDNEILYLVEKMIAEHGKTAILIADIPAIQTYIALGYSESKAKSKAVLKGNNLKNRIKKLREEKKYTEEQIRVVDWKNEIETHTEYQKIYLKILELYQSSPPFKKSAQETTKAVLENSGRMIENMDSAVEIAIHYLLSEFAFLEFAPQFFGVSNVSYIYHKHWFVYEDYISGQFDEKIRDYLDFQLVENPYETFSRLIPLEEKNDTESVLQKIQRTKKIQIAYSPYPPGFCCDENGKFSGIFYDFLCFVAQKLEVAMEIVEETGYGVIIEGLEEKRFDVFGSPIWITNERREKAYFSNPFYLSNAYEWCSPHNFSKEKIRIAVRENDISHSIAKEDFPNSKYIFTPQLADINHLLFLVAKNRADITFAEKGVVEKFCKESGENLILSSSIPRRIYSNTIMVKKGEDDFLQFLNESITEYKKKVSLEKYFEEQNFEKIILI